MREIDSCGTGLREESLNHFCSFVSIRIFGTLGLEYSGCMFFPVGASESSFLRLFLKRSTLYLKRYLEVIILHKPSSALIKEKPQKILPTFLSY